MSGAILRVFKMQNSHQFTVCVRRNRKYWLIAETPLQRADVKAAPFAEWSQMLKHGAPTFGLICGMLPTQVCYVKKECGYFALAPWTCVMNKYCSQFYPVMRWQISYCQIYEVSPVECLDTFMDQARWNKQLVLCITFFFLLCILKPAIIIHF